MKAAPGEASENAVVVTPITGATGTPVPDCISKARQPVDRHGFERQRRRGTSKRRRQRKCLPRLGTLRECVGCLSRGIGRDRETW